MGDWRVPALPNKRFEPTPQACMLTPEVVLTLNMVDNSTNPREGMSGWFFSSFSLSGRPLHPVARHSICSQLH